MSRWRAPEAEDGPDNYVAHHPDACSQAHEATGDVCPECGRALLSDETVVVDGEKGHVLDLIPPEDIGEKKAFHPDCWRERQARIAGVETSSLDEFA